MRTRLFVAALAIPVALLSACGSDDGGEGTDPEATTERERLAVRECVGHADRRADRSADRGPRPRTRRPTGRRATASGATAPSCRRGYQGCKEGDTAVKADSRGCSFGRPLVTYADRFYGVPSGVIHETAGPAQEGPRLPQRAGVLHRVTRPGAHSLASHQSHSYHP